MRVFDVYITLGCPTLCPKCLLPKSPHRLTAVKAWRVLQPHSKCVVQIGRRRARILYIVPPPVHPSTYQVRPLTVLLLHTGTFKGGGVIVRFFACKCVKLHLIFYWWKIKKTKTGAVGEWRLTTCMILWRKIQPMLLLLVRFFCNNFLSREVSCNLSVTDAKPKQMKLTEHSCCFDNEDDGNFYSGETRDSVTPPTRWDFFQRTFQTQRETAHLPSARLEPAERRTSKSSPQKTHVVSIFLSEWSTTVIALLEIAERDYLFWWTSLFF